MGLTVTDDENPISTNWSLFTMTSRLVRFVPSVALPQLLPVAQPLTNEGERVVGYSGTGNPGSQLALNPHFTHWPFCGVGTEGPLTLSARR